MKQNYKKKPIAAEMNELRFEMVPENFFIFVSTKIGCGSV